MTYDFHRQEVPSRRRPRRTAPHQAGVATLAVAVIMLLVVSVLVFHSYAASWLEQRATANQTRAKQAHAAAEAGLDVALSVLNADTGVPNRTTHLTADVTQPGRFTIANANLTGSPGDGLAYSVNLAPVAGDPPTVARLRLTSNGGSDCGNVTNVTTCNGQATVQQVIEIEPLFPYQVVSPPPAVRAATPFNTVFDVPQATMNALTTPVNDGTGFSAATSGLVWHQGNLTLGGNVGTAASPVLLIVQGNLVIPAGVVVNGFVFVIGDVTCVGCGSPSINGAIAATGANNLTAAQVQLPADAANGALARLGTTAVRFTKVIGTWRDW
ncbi:MAG: PilX N-terminal domain-containing pilus assembly protein [Betaproteobacteria bacterium]|jgi:Tfp pilus assembly protein PilX